MRWLRYAAVLVVLIVLEGVMPSLFRPFGAGPDLLLCFALALALHADSWRVVGPLWGIGIARDVMSLGPFGFYALLISSAGMILYVGRESVFRHHVLTLIMTGAVFSLLLGLAALVRLVLAGGTPLLAASIGRLTVAALLTGVVAPLVVKGLLRSRALGGFVPVREMEPAP